MKWRYKVIHFFWPFLESPRPCEIESSRARLEQQKDSIRNFSPERECDKALEEALRISDAEEKRRNGSDQKASTYLVVVSTLVPLLVTLAATVWESKVGSAPMYFNMCALALSVLYVSYAGVWAFRVLEVSVSHRIGVSDILGSWSENEPTIEITKKTLLCTVQNQDGINRKITSIKMAHAFLLRALLAFSIILLVNIVFYFASTMLSSYEGKLRHWACKLLITIDIHPDSCREIDLLGNPSLASFSAKEEQIDALSTS
ncbi:hypothetical protein M2324_003802 [Rhodovulum sulfidophilum]|uniref:hypothetical protein n=1 Tax=Rhodovulum sulfidophilum TaxID=35806 RepID=UPI000AB3AA4D|nr:hypothetical protein [Rhodovulum sulfidophilum]MCW2305380.1 hypothetical protein [Rhodovulum sulfidophilum]